MNKQTILVLSDMHIPYEHPDMLNFLKAVKKKYKPTDIICIGDEVDFHAMSFHDSDPDLMSAGDELDLAIKKLKPIYKLFPNVTVVNSNHGSMAMRKALANGIPKALIKSNNDVLDAPKTWKWVNDVTIKTPLGKVYFCHGKSGAAGRLASQYGLSTVQGHYHEKAQITFISTPDKLMFDMHVGCLADDNSLALAYNKINPRRPIISLGVIVNGIPHIVPMIINKGKWIGTL